MELEKSKTILTTAENLLSKLEDERTRWDVEYKNIEK